MEHSFHEVRALTSDPLTLDYFFKNLERGESIILELPNGETRKYTYYSFLSKSDGALQIVMPCKYDQTSKTYYLKTVHQKDNTKDILKRALNSVYGINQIWYKPGLLEGCNSYVYDGPKIKKVIHSGPATIIFWNDGTKTVVKAQEEVDDEKGILYAALKKLATKKEYNDILRAIDEACKDSPAVEKKHPSDQKCPYCGANWNMTIQRSKLLQKHGIVKITCGKCHKMFNVWFKDAVDEYACTPFYKRGCGV